MCNALPRRLGLRNPVLWLNPHDAVHLAGRLDERAVIYDITDDWSELTQSAALRQLTIAQDAELCRRADAVIVCSEKLLEKKRPLARNLHLVPNGVDAAHYARVLDATGPLPPEAAAWRQAGLRLHRDDPSRPRRCRTGGKNRARVSRRQPWRSSAR